MKRPILQKKPRHFFRLVFFLFAVNLLASGCTPDATPTTPIPLTTAKAPSAQEIRNAESRWEATGNENYFVSVEETTPEGAFRYRMVIVEGEIQAAQRLEQIDGEWQPPAAIKAETAAYYTVDALFARILRDAAGEGPAPLNMFVMFDPLSGYPAFVEAKAIPGYTEDGRLRLNREHSYTLSISIDALLEETFGLNKTPVLTLTRSNGEEAACSMLRIFDDGTSVYTDNCRQNLLQINPPASSMEQLRTLAAEYGSVEDTQSRQAADSRLVLEGSGAGTPDSDALDGIWTLALHLNDLLSQPVGAGITLLRRSGDMVIGYDMHTNLEQPASLPIQAPLYGGISDREGKRIIYTDSAGVRWLDIESGERGTIIANPAGQHFVPAELTTTSHIILQRYSGSSDHPEWGWISFAKRRWQPMPVEITCITAVSASPDGTRIAVASEASPGCEPAAALWIVHLETGETETLAGDNWGAVAVDWSTEGARLAAVLHPADSNAAASGLYLADAENGSLTPLVVPDAGRLSGVVWSREGDRLVYGLTGAGAGISGLYAFDLERGNITSFLEGENLIPLGFDPSGEFLSFSSGDDLGTWLLGFDQVISITLQAPSEAHFFGWIDSRIME